ncbi:conserved unknown protein [Ectocarpus siliculosus]|uniref:Uncharacterized protein n=1 Tax=Ectocarpus siliculosus TaxID=2880 RepID=D8LGM5_ECTSI|nr:conserved unknown protein [Ectocarpus siliculosus]|eukprot:CBN75767.1 conserved unknown protein [Ectocarpus siliculosus]
MMLLLSLHGRAARIAPPFSAQHAKQVLASASARLHMPPVPRLQGPAVTRTVVAVAAAATGATAARGFLAARDGSAGGVGVGNLLERLGARGVLAARLVSDFAAASMASLMVSPFISIVDRAIIQSASGSMGMKASVAQGFRVLATKPALFLARPDFICTFCLYGATYLAANTISTMADEFSRSDTMPKFLGTTAINMPGSIAKDQALTKIFGVVGSAAKVPAASFALFTVRDVATMAAAFTLPTPMSTKMQDFGVDSGMADVTSQLVSPGLVQLFSTPDSFMPAIAMRVARIGVAFGVGGLGNTSIRNKLHGAIAKSAWAKQHQ